MRRRCDQPWDWEANQKLNLKGLRLKYQNAYQVAKAYPETCDQKLRF